jgi:hypothetical protein
LTRALAALVTALALFAGCGGGSDEPTTYTQGEVEQAFREAGLTLQRLPAAGAEQPAMGETSSCGTRYLVRARGALVSVSICDAEADAADVAPGGSMHRGNVAVETAATDAATHERIERALDALDG